MKSRQLRPRHRVSFHTWASCLTALLLLAPLPADAETASTADAGTQTAEDGGTAADYAAAAQLQVLLKAGDRRAVTKLIQFPLEREAPLAPITSAGQFLAHWNQYFDEASIKAVLEDKPEQYGWRGIAMLRGGIWFKDGHIISIFPSDGAFPVTAAYRNALAAARAADAAALHPSARGYDHLGFECTTKTLHVRTQFYSKDSQDLRYFAWKRGQSLSAKPALALKGGVLDAQGSGGNSTQTFKNEGYSYQLEITVLCAEDCNSYLAVSKQGRVISRQVCSQPAK